MSGALPCGKHLLIDAYGCKRLGDASFLLDTISELVRLIGMKFLVPPIVVQGSPHLPGLSCFCIIETSHIAIHTFIDEDKVAIDVYSCKAFDPGIAYDYLKLRFGFGRVPVHEIHDRM